MSEMIDGCPACEGTRATAWMITHLRPPVTLQSCEQDIAQNLIVTLASVLNVDGQWLYGQIEQAVNGAADEHDAQQAAAAEPDEADDDGDPGHISHDTAEPVKPRPRKRAKPDPDNVPAEEVGAGEVPGA